MDSRIDDRRLCLGFRVPVETTEDALTGVPVETYCRASTQGAQRCIQHLACRCAPRRPHDFGPRLKGALQKHLPGNACTRRRSLSRGSTPPTSLSWPVNMICVWFIAYAAARQESICDPAPPARAEGLLRLLADRVVSHTVASIPAQGRCRRLRPRVALRFLPSAQSVTSSRIGLVRSRRALWSPGNEQRCAHGRTQ